MRDGEKMHVGESLGDALPVSERPDYVERVPPQRGRSVLLVGDFAHGDFAEAVAWLAVNVSLHSVPGIAEALDCLGESGPPEVLLFAQSRPGQLSQREVECLHRHTPLSRLVVLLGSWCEGEARTGRPWPGVIRVYWHQWHPRLISELVVGGTASRGVWRLPRTASLGEQLACASEGLWPQNQGLVAIYTRSCGDYEALRDACAAGGYASTWCRLREPTFSSSAAAVLYDAIGGDPEDALQLARLARRHRPAPVVALLDFVRRADLHRALDSGAAAVIAKPFLVADLLWHLDRHLHKSRAA